MNSQHNPQSRRILCCLGALALLLAAGLCLALPTDSEKSDPGVPQTDGNVLAIASTTTRIYVGGTFTSINGVARNNIAAIDPATGEVDAAWNPNLNGSVYAIAVDGTGNGKVYVGGAFTAAKGGLATRKYVAAFDPANGGNSGEPDSEWAPELNDTVRALAIGANNKVYVGGEFTQVVSDTATRNRLVAFSKADGSNEAALDAAWDPNLNNNVLALKLAGDPAKLYVGGSFTTVLNGTVTRNGLAAFNQADGSSAAAVDTAWDPNIDGAVLGIEWDGFGSIIVVGTFLQVMGSTPRSFNAVFNMANGTSAASLHGSWDLAADVAIFRVLNINGTIYLGGMFTKVTHDSTDYPAPYLVAVQGPRDNNPGKPISTWYPTPDARVLALAMDPSSSGLLAGGYFTTIQGVARAHLAGFGTAMTTRYVTNTNDSGPGSLRQTIADAENLETIKFLPALTGQTILLTSGEIVVDNKAVIVDGLGMDALTISGGNVSRIFRVTVTGTLAIGNMAVANGRRQPTDGSVAEGGGIHNTGYLELYRVDLHHCTAAGATNVGSGTPHARGGGIWNIGQLSINESRIRDNLADGGTLFNFPDNLNGYDGEGGGIYNIGHYEIDKSEISFNIARGDKGDGTGSVSARGGGIYESNTSLNTMENCTLSGNQTISGFSGVSFGGGLYDSYYSSLRYCTVAFNSSTGSSASKRGAGVYSADADLGPTIRYSIFANNTGPAAADGPDLYGNFFSDDYNLIRATGGFTLLGGGLTNDILGRNPLLFPLQDNGGFTHTHALRYASPARNAIPASQLDTSRDQRRQPRPYPTDGAGDIGAFEDQGEATPVQRIVINTNDSGAGSLRQILIDCDEGDEILFDAGLSGQTITLNSGEIVINKDVTLTGLGMNSLTISGNDASRVFTIAAGCSVAISDLTVAQGSVIAATPKGGGIYNEGMLVLSRVSVRDCMCKSTGSGDASGGGIYSESNSSLEMTDCRLRMNTAEAYMQFVSGPIGFPMPVAGSASGGAIHSAGSLSMDGCEVSNNTAKNINEHIGGDAHGGGILASSVANVTNCTISGNVANGGLGSSYGGGIKAADGLTLTFCTVAYNEAQGTSTKRGGGVFSYGGVGSGPRIVSSIFANNTSGGGADGSDLYGNFVTKTHNLIETTEGYTLTSTIGYDIIGQSAKLNPLADNGGPTQTHSLQPTSPAMDSVIDTLMVMLGINVPTTDQRGLPRPSPASGQSDIGAFEHQRNPIQRVVTNNNDSGAGSLRQVLSDCYPGDSVIFDAGLNGQTITLTSGELVIGVDLTLAGLGMNSLTLSGNNASRVFNIAAGTTVEITDLTIANGKAPNPWGVDAKGGGIYSEATRLHLRRLLLRDCLSLAAENGGGYGGGLYHSGGEELSLWDCRIVGNTVAGYTNPGGGPLGGDVVKPGVGGGIYCVTSGQFAMLGCEVSDNMAQSGVSSGDFPAEAKGGGVYFQCMLLSGFNNCTLSGNITDGTDGSYGGGIYGASACTFRFCTVTLNETRGNGTKEGGGIYGEGILKNSLFANNSSGTGADLKGTFTSQNYNLIRNTTGYTMSGTTTNNIEGQDPLLGPLQDNGGPTWTHALLDGSPALDWIPATEIGTITTDQRGEPRPSPSDGNADIGAYEHQFVPSGPSWSLDRTYSDLTETANAEPVWDSFRFDVLNGSSTPGGITVNKTPSRLNITASMSQSTPGPYGQWGPPPANEFTLDAAAADKLWRFKVKMGSSNANTAQNPMIRLSLNGRTQGPGEGGREFAKNSGSGTETNGPVSAATKVFSTYLWPAAPGKFAPTFLVYDDDANVGGTIFVETSLALQSVPKADMTGGTVVVDQGQGAATGFVGGTEDGQWSVSAASFAGIIGYTFAPIFTSSISSSLMTVGVSGTSGAGQGGLVKYGSSNLFTAQADKIYLVKARVAASLNTGAIPDLRIFCSAGNAVAYHLQGRNIDAGSGPITTPKDYVCVIETDAQNAGLWSLGLEAIVDPGQSGNLQISRVTVEEYAKPTE